MAQITSVCGQATDLAAWLLRTSGSRSDPQVSTARKGGCPLAKTVPLFSKTLPFLAVALGSAGRPGRLPLPASQRLRAAACRRAALAEAARGGGRDAGRAVSVGGRWPDQTWRAVAVDLHSGQG